MIRRPAGPRSERGSVIFLYPVGFLIMLLLGAIAVDVGNAWLQQRRLADAADAAVNDAVTYGLDQDVLRRNGLIALDRGRVAEVVVASVAAQELPPGAAITDLTIGVNAAGNPTVSVTIDSTAELIFGRLVRGGAIDIGATGVAELAGG